MNIGMRKLSVNIAILLLIAQTADASADTHFVKHRNILIPILVDPAAPMAPLSPSTLTGVLNPNGNLAVSWSAVTGATSYKLQWYNSNSVTWENVYDGATTSFVVVLSTLADGAHQWRARACNAGGCGFRSPILNFTIDEDNDNDGINNDVDLCLGTPGGESVDNNGCSLSQLDADGDGVFDVFDICPSTGSGLAVDIQGCAATQDSDGDGIPNNVDSYPHQSTTQCLP